MNERASALRCRSGVGEEGREPPSESAIYSVEEERKPKEAKVPSSSLTPSVRPRPSASVCVCLSTSNTPSIHPTIPPTSHLPSVGNPSFRIGPPAPIYDL